MYPNNYTAMKTQEFLDQNAANMKNGVWWKGANGHFYAKGAMADGVQDLGSDQYGSLIGRYGYKEIADPNPPKGGGGDNNRTASNTGVGFGGGGGYVAPKPVLDQAQLDSLDSLIASLSTVKDRAFEKARVKRDTSRSEKKAERDREDKKYQGKKISTIQDFNSAKVDTDLNTTATLENLISSLSTLGLGGSRALTRQILDAANKSNRKANETQATNTRGLDSAWNEYQAGYESDLDKIDDQYGFDTGEAEKAYLTGKQNALYKKADVYNAVDDTANRSRLMNEARGLNDNIADSAFVNPKYTGKRRAMDTPDLADYNQDIATYETALDIGDGVTPLAADSTTGAGNLAVKAIAVNDKDLGIKKKTEAELGYGV